VGRASIGAVDFPESPTRPGDTDAPGPAPDYEGADYALRDAMTAHRCDCRPSPAREGSHDEGEAYAARLRAAGTEVTTVRYDGITHDFMMQNALRDTHAARAAIVQAIAILRNALNTT
jgi:acetyl esterase/lipase